MTTFVSSVPDPRAYAVDAMSLSWEGMFRVEDHIPETV
jgi:hypothetical protein